MAFPQNPDQRHHSANNDRHCALDQHKSRIKKTQVKTQSSLQFYITPAKRMRG
jgi:hypothetical protein